MICKIQPYVNQHTIHTQLKQLQSLLDDMMLKLSYVYVHELCILLIEKEIILTTQCNITVSHLSVAKNHSN